MYSIVKSYGTPLLVDGENYRVRHIFCRRTPRPPKFNIPSIGLDVIIFLWISAGFPSREEWYGSIELEVISENFYTVRKLAVETNMSSYVKTLFSLMIFISDNFFSADNFNKLMFKINGINYGDS